MLGNKPAPNPCTVAIVVPGYNAEATIAATLESALVQDHVAEIVVVDDGSSDGTFALARSFEPWVRVLNGPRQGVSAARNRGISETAAEWLLFLDSDDLLAPRTLVRRLDVAAAGNADVIICDWEEMNDDGNGKVSQGPRRTIDWPAMTSDAELTTATHGWATTAAILYRRGLVERIGGFRPDLPVIQDARFLFDAVHHGARIAHAPHLGARYRILPGSLSRRNPGRFWQDVLRNGRQIEALWRANGTLDAPPRKAAVLGIYNNAARGLFTAADPHYFEAVEALRRLGSRQPLHSRLSEPLARLVGLNAASAMFALVQRG